MTTRSNTHQPERTCIGCRSVRKKDDVIRIVAGPNGVLIDYREKLEGRAAYICPRYDCIEKGLKKESLSRALHKSIKQPEVSLFLHQLESAVLERVKSLLRIALKADKLAVGYSAVQDALEKGRVALLLSARDLAPGTLEKISASEREAIRQETLFTRDDLGALANRELVGIVAVLDRGLADAIWTETQRLKGLINTGD